MGITHIFTLVAAVVALVYGDSISSVVNTKPLYFATFDNITNVYENIGVLDEPVYFIPMSVTPKFCIGKYAVQTVFLNEQTVFNHIKLPIPVEVSPKSDGLTVCVDISEYIPGGIFASTSDNILYLYTDKDGNFYTAINETDSIDLDVNIYYYMDSDKFTTFCITNDNNNYRTLYVNGVHVSSVNAGPITKPFDIPYIGGNPMVKYGAVAHYIDNVIVYDYVASNVLETISNIKVSNSCQYP